MTFEFLAGLLIGGGVAALLGWIYGVREGMERAARMWRGQR